MKQATGKPHAKQLANNKAANLKLDKLSASIFIYKGQKIFGCLGLLSKLEGWWLRPYKGNYDVSNGK